MTPTLYSIRTHIDSDGAESYAITKFVDGDVESSYLTTRSTCTCPAGQRPTCRHRQMLPLMLNEQIVNTHWFLNWDAQTATVVDFEGTSKRTIEALAAPEGLHAEPLRFDKDYSNSVGHGPAYDLLADLPPNHSARSGDDIGRMSFKPWRRL